jgi:hypothetical protein
MSVAIIEGALLALGLDGEARAAQNADGSWTWESAESGTLVHAGTATITPCEPVIVAFERPVAVLEGRRWVQQPPLIRERTPSLWT